MAALSDMFHVEFYGRPGWREHYKDGGWVTIGGGPGAGGSKHSGGTPVQIGSGGEIKKGPGSIEGKTIGQISGGTAKAGGGFNRATAKESMNRNGVAEHEGTKAAIESRDDGLGYKAVITSPDGTAADIVGGEYGQSWRDAQEAALDSLADASPTKATDDQPKQKGLFGDVPVKTPQPKAKQEQKDLFPKKGDDVPEPEESKAEEKSDESSYRGLAKELDDGRMIGATFMRPGDMVMDPSRFQYKVEGIGESGTTEELKDVKTFNPDFWGSVTVWRDPADGKTYVVNGHHRAELAKNTGYDQPLPVYYTDAKDAKEARSAGALVNIAEGRGTAVDAAKFMRDADVTVDDFARHGVSMKGKIADEGARLAKASDAIFRKVIDQEMTTGRAMAITTHVEDHKVQDDLMKRIDQKERTRKDKYRDSVVEEMATEAAMASNVTEKETDLFGTHEEEVNLFAERAELKDGVKRKLAELRNTYKAVTSKKRAGRLGKAGETNIDRDETRRLAQEAEASLFAFGKLSKYKGPISDAINEASKSYRGQQPSKLKGIVEGLLGQLKPILEAEFGGQGPPPAEPEGGTGHGGDVVEKMARMFRACYVQRYERTEPVAENSKKVEKVNAGLRPAFGAARCGACSHYNSGSKTCGIVAGDDILPADTCDLYQPTRGEDLTAKLSREYLEMVGAE